MFSLMAGRKTYRGRPDRLVIVQGLEHREVGVSHLVPEEIRALVSRVEFSEDGVESRRSFALVLGRFQREIGNPSGLKN